GGARVVEGPAPARPLRLAWEQVRMPGLLRRLAVDVHHGPHYTMPMRAAIPAVVTIHDLTFFDHPEWHERPKVHLFRRAIRLSARRAAALVCVSRGTAARLQTLLAPAAPVTVIPHGVDHDRYRPLAAEDAAGAERDRSLLSAVGARAPYM